MGKEGWEGIERLVVQALMTEMGDGWAVQLRAWGVDRCDPLMRFGRTELSHVALSACTFNSFFINKTISENVN